MAHQDLGIINFLLLHFVAEITICRAGIRFALWVHQRNCVSEAARQIGSRLHLLLGPAVVSQYLWRRRLVGEAKVDQVVDVILVEPDPEVFMGCDENLMSPPDRYSLLLFFDLTNLSGWDDVH